MAPRAKNTVARYVRRIPVGVDSAGWKEYEHAIIVVYIANVEGRKAALSSKSITRAYPCSLSTCPR